MKLASPKNYAQAVIGLEAEEKLDGKVIQDLETIFDAIKTEAELKKALNNKRIQLSEKASALKEIFGSKVSLVSCNLIFTLIRNNKLRLLPRIIKLAKEMRNDANAVQEVEVQTVVKLSEAQEKSLSKYLAKKLKRKIIMKNSLNPEIIGGIKILSKDIMIDSSIQGRLKSLEQILKS